VLFKIAYSTRYSEPLNVYSDSPMSPLTLVSQNVHGKIFMKALGPADSCGMAKKDAAGHVVPPQYEFCPRLQQMGAESFQRVTEYQLGFQSDFGPADGGQNNVSRYNIAILDKDLVDPAPGAWCLIQGCDGHGSIDRHAVPFVGAKAAWSDITEAKVWDQYLWGDIVPRAFFAGCSKVLIYQTLLHPPPWPALPDFRFSTEAREASLEPESQLPAISMADWAATSKLELRYLASILEVIQADSRTCVAEDPTYGVQIITRLQPNSDREEAHCLRLLYCNPWTTDHELFSEELGGTAKLVSAGDRVALHSWMAAEGTLETDLLAIDPEAAMKMA
jgi:hypothetical protein